MRSMRSIRGGLIFRNRGPSLKVHQDSHASSRDEVSVLFEATLRLGNLFINGFCGFIFLLIQSK
jgi:hypothetical protein